MLTRRQAIASAIGAALVPAHAFASSKPGVPVWPRPAYTSSGSLADVFVYAFFESGTPEPPRFSRKQHGFPEGGLPSSLDLRQFTVDEHPGVIDNLRTGAVRTLAANDLTADDLAALDRAKRAMAARIEVRDPTDLSHLQVIWAIRRAFFEMGGTVQLDLHAARWDAGKLLDACPVGTSFQVQREISIPFETKPTQTPAGFGHACHTRGMIKFARPDLMIGVARPADGPDAVADLNAIASRLALGEQLKPKQVVAVA